jgi:hypothetical protein
LCCSCRQYSTGSRDEQRLGFGDADLARCCLEESLSLARETADRTQEILCLLHLGWLCIRQKLPSEALQHLQAGLELAEKIGSCTEQGWLLCGLAEAYRLTSELGLAPNARSTWQGRQGVPTTKNWRAGLWLGWSKPDPREQICTHFVRSACYTAIQRG